MKWRIKWLLIGTCGLLELPLVLMLFCPMFIDSRALGRSVYNLSQTNSVENQRKYQEARKEVSSIRESVTLAVLAGALVNGFVIFSLKKSLAKP